MYYDPILQVNINMHDMCHLRADELKLEMLKIVVVCFNSYNTFIIPHLEQ